MNLCAGKGNRKWAGALSYQAAGGGKMLFAQKEVLSGNGRPRMRPGGAVQTGRRKHRTQRRDSTTKNQTFGPDRWQRRRKKNW
jgi:hypothetical protein